MLWLELMARLMIGVSMKLRMKNDAIKANFRLNDKQYWNNCCIFAQDLSVIIKTRMIL